MAHGRSFRRAYSLRTPKSPSLLDSTYGPLEEKTENSDKAKQRVKRRAVSLRGWKSGMVESPAERTPTPGEMPHSLSLDDGELLIGEAQSKGSHRMKQCKKQVDQALRRGWETFVANLYSVTLSRPAPPSEAAPSLMRTC
ncbi:uncharacterized protein C11orf86 homolog isoform 1-T1 [Pangshura tecta]